MKITIEIDTKKKLSTGTSVTVVASLQGYHEADPIVQQVADTLLDGMQDHMREVAERNDSNVIDHMANVLNAGRG